MSGQPIPTQTVTESVAACHMARLLAGDVADTGIVAALPAPWSELAKSVIGADGGDRLEVFEAALAKLPSDQARHIRHVVFKVDPASPPPTATPEPGPPPVDVPELPQAAGLPTALQQDTLGVGHWFTDYAEYAEQVSPRTPMLFHEAAGLFAGGLAIARRLRLALSHGDVFPNLYILWIAPTTLWAKSTALRVCNNLIDSAVPHLLLSSEFTPEALLSELAGKDPSGLVNESEETRKLWAAGRNFAAQRGIILDEASGLFAGFRRDYMAGLAEMMLRLYDGPALYRRHTRGGGFTIARRAALSFLGATTPASLQRANVEIGWHNGLFARFALLTPDSPPVYITGDTRPDPPQQLTTALQRLADELLPVPTFPDPPCIQDVEIESRAFEAWQLYDKALAYDLLTGDEKPDTRLWGAYGRLPTQALKVALILAALDWAAGPQRRPCITAAHWARGQMVAEKWRASAHRVLGILTGDRAEQEQEDRILRVLRRADREGLTAREVGQMLNCRRRDIEPLLEDLVKDEILETHVPAGKKVDRYRLPAVEG